VLHRHLFPHLSMPRRLAIPVVLWLAQHNALFWAAFWWLTWALLWLDSAHLVAAAPLALSYLTAALAGCGVGSVTYLIHSAWVEPVVGRIIRALDPLYDDFVIRTKAVLAEAIQSEFVFQSPSSDQAQQRRPIGFIHRQ
jgi:hypothetical protein